VSSDTGLESNPLQPDCCLRGAVQATATRACRGFSMEGQGHPDPSISSKYSLYQTRLFFRITRPMLAEDAAS
jgi:hypothetical protein